MMKVTSAKTKSKDNSTAITKTKTASKVFASASKADAPTVRRNVLPTQPVKFTACKKTHPLWRCPVFRAKTPTHKAKVVADNKLCVSRLNGQHSFRHCPKPRKCTTEGCSRSHNVSLLGIERVFPPRPLPTQNNATENSSVPVKKESGESSGDVSQTDVKGLLRNAEVELQSPTRTGFVLVFCDSACSHL